MNRPGSARAALNLGVRRELMRRARVVVVSCTGSGRKRTLPALHESSICEVVAVHGRDASTLIRVADEFGVPAHFTSLEAMIAAGGFDMAVVCSPPFLHR